MDSFWTEENSEKAANMWKTGLTAKEIADDLGVTRNAAIGKISRMGLAKIERPKRPRAKPKRHKKTKVLGNEVAFTPVPDDPELITNPDRIHPFDAAIPRKQRCQTWELSDDRCKWPVGDTHKKGFYHCGGSLVAGYPYCLDHCNRAYYPTRPIEEVI